MATRTLKKIALSERDATPCASALLNALGVDRFRWTWNGRRNTWADILRRNGFAVRSRRSRLPKRCTVGAARTRLARLVADGHDPAGTVYAVVVPSHVLLLANDGRTLVDTAPRKRDRRPVRRVYAIWRRGSQ